jgi:uncharacterized protein YyaL (SSP411 family)
MLEHDESTTVTTIGAAGTQELSRINGVLDAVLDYSEAQHWQGFDKHDALNSPILEALCGWSRVTRLLAVQSVMRSPVNVRPILLTPRTFNPKGLALFMRGLLDRYALDGNEHHLVRIRALASQLDAMAVVTPSGGRAWGYQYPWQDLGFFAPRGTPNAIVTAFVCEAFLAAHRQLKEAEWLSRVEAAIPFFLGDLQRLKDEPEELCLSYMPLPMNMRVMDVSIWVASVLAQFARQANQPQWFEPAKRLACYVVRRQTDYHAWFYTDPPGDSPIRHDNYHTGFILDALSNYMDATGEREWQSQYDTGLAFYAKHLFEPNGAPRWMSDRGYPYDIHGAAQGILTFSRHMKTHGDLARRTVDWALAEMYNPEGRFYHQRTRWYTKKFTQLRWCNAWMVRALAAYAKGIDCETH